MLREGIGLIFLVIIYIIQRVFFNMITRQPQRYEIWFYTDIVVSIVILTGMLFLRTMRLSEMLTTATKEPFDLTIAVIVVITWFRFFNFFLLVPRLARLIVTLY